MKMTPAMPVTSSPAPGSARRPWEIFAPQSYSVSVSKSGDGDQILIRGLYNQGSTFVVQGLVDVDQLTLPTQSVDGFTLSGSGTLNAAGDRVDLNFAINDGSGTDNVTANWTK